MLSSSRTKDKNSVGAVGGNAAGIADWLCLAAAPTFALMAILTVVTGGADAICSSMQGASALDGMVTMYLIMSAFHLPPWLRLLSGRSDKPRTDDDLVAKRNRKPPLKSQILGERHA